MKKVLVLFLILSLIISTFTTVGFAGEKEDSSKAQISEYEVFEELSEIPTKDLLARGFTSEEVQVIKDYDKKYQEHIKELSSRSDDILLKFGYSEEQISIIRNYSGQEEETRSLSATLTIVATQKLFTWDRNYTTGKFSYKWQWQGMPMSKSEDIVAIGWNGWWATSENCYVRYYDMTTGDFVTSKSLTKVSPDGNQGGIGGIGYKFKLRPLNTNSFAQKGEGSAYVQSDTHTQKDFFYYLSYGHTQLTASPSFSVSSSDVSAGVTFSAGVIEMDFDNNDGKPVVAKVG